MRRLALPGLSGRVLELRCALVIAKVERVGSCGSSFRRSVRTKHKRRKQGKTMKSMFLLALLAATAMPHSAVAQEAEAEEYAWQEGPTTGAIAGKATVAVPEGYVFLDARETKRFLESNQNLADGEEYLLAPTSGDFEAYFSFSPEGYVQDNEELDADALLASMRATQAEANKKLKSRGWATGTITSWYIPPRYNPTTKVLEWAINYQSSESPRPTVNYFTKVLGRKGVTTVQVVASPDKIVAALPEFQERLTGFNYLAGERYADFRKGDHIAEYGLAALVTGGVAAVATKKGFFAMIGAFFAAAWKFLLVGIIAVGGWIKSVFSKKPRNDK